MSAPGDSELEASVEERYGKAFCEAMREVRKKALAGSSSATQLKEREYFLERQETPEGISGWLCKLVLHAPEQWYEIVSGGMSLPPDVKNDFKQIGVSFDASSRLRRAAITFYHERLTERLQSVPGHIKDGVYYVNRQGGSSTGEVIDMHHLPEKEGTNTYRVVAISDTHLFHTGIQLPRGDILIHSGDLSYEESRSTSADKFEKYRKDGGELSGAKFRNWVMVSDLPLSAALEWLGSHKEFEHRVLVGGNHDYILEQIGAENARDLCSFFNVTYLHTDFEVQSLHLSRGRGAGTSVRVWGSGLSFMAGLSANRAVVSGNNAFQITKDEGDAFLQKRREALPQGDVDIMVVHSPPQSGTLLSKPTDGTDHISDMIKHVRPKLYVCGHSHRPDDPLKGIAAELGGTLEGHEWKALGVNAACLGVWNQLHGYPVVVDMEPGLDGSPAASAPADSAADSELEALAEERYGKAFCEAMREVRKKAFLESSSAAQQKERRYFIERQETPEGITGWLCKLVLHAPEQWYEIVSEMPLPPDVKNDFKQIGVSFDASSRLRRAGITFYHERLTERLQAVPGHIKDGAYYVNARGGGSAGELINMHHLPDKQGEHTYRVVAISDTHLFHAHLALPRGDILIHSGDLSYEESRSTSAYKFNQYRDAGGEDMSGETFRNWMKASDLPLFAALEWLGRHTEFEHRILVGGNHDYILEQIGAKNARDLCRLFQVTYLHTDFEVQSLHFSKGRAAGTSVRVWGSGLSFMAGLSANRAVVSGNNAFQITKDEGDDFLQKRRDALPQGDVDIMVVHSPPQTGTLLAKTTDGTDHISDTIKHVRPKLYVCGHAHRPDDPLKGITAELGGTLDDGCEWKTLGVNAACLGVWNQLHGYPIVIDMEASPPPEVHHALGEDVDMLRFVDQFSADKP